MQKLEDEIERKKDETEKLKKEIDKRTRDNQYFSEIRGIKIRKLATGQFEESTAYCFHCESPLSASGTMKYLECSKCGYKTSIQRRYLLLVIQELKGEKTPDWWR